VFDQCEFLTPAARVMWVTWHSTAAVRHNGGVTGRGGVVGGYKPSRRRAA